jgi:gamma-glutamylcyclotransferase (GGCT)/AIG2-like uncharacterized protein YtfP
MWRTDGDIRYVAKYHRKGRFVDKLVWICQNTPMETKTLFVYGTLMQGMRNHIYLEKEKFLGVSQTKPEYELVYNGSIPAVRPGNESVKGEVYEVTDEALKSLDVLEEVDTDLYDRSEVELADGKKAIIYLGGGRMFASDVWQHVPGGDYRKLMEGQK